MEMAGTSPAMTMGVDCFRTTARLMRRALLGSVS
jgi:hypothetical protein